MGRRGMHGKMHVARGERHGKRAHGGHGNHGAQRGNAGEGCPMHAAAQAHYALSGATLVGLCGGDRHDAPFANCRQHRIRHRHGIRGVVSIGQVAALALQLAFKRPHL